MRGFARIGAAVPACGVTDFSANLREHLALAERAHAQAFHVVAFPELGLTSYTARDLFHDHHLLERAQSALRELVARSREWAPLFMVGLPLRVGSALFNVAVGFQRGEVLGVVPKAYLPNYREFEEARWFRSGCEVAPGSSCTLLDNSVPFGSDVLFRGVPNRDLVVGVEICEDLWVHVPPHVFQVSAGATVICNLSASNFTVGKAELRRRLATSASDRGKCAYVYVAAGPGESSTDLAFDADAFVCENGRVLESSQRFDRESQLVGADVDLELLVRERLVTTTFGDCSREHARPFRGIEFAAEPRVRPALRRTVSRSPFVPEDPAVLDARCWEIFEIQTNALATRMRALGRPPLVLGVSGGLDSTHAALVCAGALDLAGQPRTDLLCATMPGLGTTDHTRDNAVALVQALGGELRTISISEVSHHVLSLVGHAAALGTDSAQAMLAKLAQQPDRADVTFENVQARLRTLVLMSLANAHGGIVVGTGDLSEKALGWSTYAGDHISMYDVNGGVPKTLIRFVVQWVAQHRAATWSAGAAVELGQILGAVLATPISPELLPPVEGAIVQRTEDTLGPYELHDFFLYHFVRHGARPGRVLDLARIAFPEVDPARLRGVFAVFMRRFFANQWKRSCVADGPKVGQVALSPRGDWRMPSDARVRSWLEAIERWPANADDECDEAFERR